MVGLYFAVLLGIIWWVVKQKQESTEDYFLAGRHVGWFVIGASIFASNIGSEHVVGLAGTAAASGMAMAHYELHSWIVLTLGWVFVPFYPGYHFRRISEVIAIVHLFRTRSGGLCHGSIRRA